MSLTGILQRLGESVLDEPKDSLCPDIWSGDPPRMKESVRDQIFSLFGSWSKKVELTDPDIKKIYMLGSLSGFNYTEKSDLDVDVELKVTDEEIAELQKYLNKEVNGKTVTGTDHPINFHVLNTGMEPEAMGAVYDLLEEEWVRKPVAYQIQNYQYVVETAIQWCRKLDLSFGEMKRDLIEYFTYQDLLGGKGLRGNKDEMEFLFRHKIMEVKANLDSMRTDLEALKAVRNAEFEKEPPEFLVPPNASGGDANTRLGNIIFKTVEKYGYIGILKTANKIRKTLLDSGEEGIDSVEDELRELIGEIKEEQGEGFTSLPASEWPPDQEEEDENELLEPEEPEEGT